MPELKCVSAWESDLFEALVRMVTLLWLIWSNVEQNITLTAKAQFSYLRTMRVPLQWWMRFIFFRRLASRALFLVLLPCQTWKQEWNHLKLPLVDCYCSSAFLHSTVTQMLKMFRVMTASKLHCVCAVMCGWESLWRRLWGKTRLSSTNRNIWDSVVDTELYVLL